MGSFLYVSKRAPSMSGVARYADFFEPFLRTLGPVTPVRTGHESGETRRIRSFPRVARELLAALRSDPSAVTWVELSGGALAELWVVGAVAIVTRRRYLATVHDCPEIVGGALAFQAFDDRPYRRFARVIRTAEPLLERILLSRAMALYCLSAAGRDAVVASRPYLAGRVHTMPPALPAPPLERRPCGARPTVFLPGPVGAHGLRRFIRALDASGHQASVDLIVGYPSPGEEHEVEALVARLSTASVLERCSQEVLTATYGTAHAVVRLWDEDDPRWSWANSQAVSGPVLDAIAAGAVMITNAARGGDEHVLRAGGVVLTRGATELESVLGRVLEPRELRERRADVRRARDELFGLDRMRDAVGLGPAA